jgi:LTXXQ motif family protein
MRGPRRVAGRSREANSTRPAPLLRRREFPVWNSDAPYEFGHLTEARHGRYHWHHHHGFYQGTDEDRGEDPVLRTFGKYRSRIEADGFGRGIKQMIDACTGQAVELKRIPFDLVSRTVQANGAQRNALERIHSTANDAAETLSATCPKDIPAELGQRLDQLGRALDAIAASLAALRPALATFYDTLDDEQKARLVAIDFSRKSLSKFDQDERTTANGGVPDDGSDAARDPVCRQWVAILRSWPIKQVESVISLSDEQHADLHDLAAACYRAAGSLVGACPAKDHFTALGHLDAKQHQLQALRQGIDAIQPILSKFEDSLNDSQRTRLAIAVNG